MGTPNNIASGFLQGFVGTHGQLSQQADQQEKDKQSRILQALLSAEPNVAPEYREAYHSKILEMLDLPSGKKGSAQASAILAQLRQIDSGQGPEVQTQNNEFGGYQGVSGNNLGTPPAPTSSPVSLANSLSTMNSAPLAGSTSVAGGASVPLAKLGGMLQQQPLSTQIPLSTGDSSGGVDTFNNGLDGQGQPLAKSLVQTPLAPATQPLYNTVDKSGFDVKGRIPLMEDPQQKQLKLQTSLADIRDDLDEKRQQRMEDRAARLAKQKNDYTIARDKQHNEDAVKLVGLKGDLKDNQQINTAKANLAPITPKVTGETDDQYNARLTGLAATAVKHSQDVMNEQHQAHTDLYKQQKTAIQTKLDQQQSRIDTYSKNIDSLIAKRGEDAQTRVLKQNVSYLKARKDTVKTQFDSIDKEEAKLKPDQEDYAPRLKALENQKSEMVQQMTSLDDDIQRVEQGGTAQGDQRPKGGKGGGGQPTSQKIFPSANLQDYANKLHGGDIAAATAEIQKNGYIIK